MLELPKCSVLVRTSFDDDAGWSSLLATVASENEEGFVANVVPIDDVTCEGLTAHGLQSANAGAAMVSFLADEQTFASGDHPILAVPVLHPSDDDTATLKPFRVVAAELWSVENNLNEANMDWFDFADAVGADGVFRGFPDPQPISDPPRSHVEQRGAAASSRIVEALRGGGHRDQGPRGTVIAGRQLRATPAAAYDMATRMSFWMTHGAIAHPIEVGGPYQINSGGSSHPRASLFGYRGAVKGRYRHLEPNQTVEMTWNWHAPPSTGTSLLTVASYLDWETVVRWTISAGDTPEQALISVEHSDVPAEWVPDLTEFWVWNLEYVQVVLEVRGELHRRRQRR